MPITPEEWRHRGSELVIPEGRIFMVEMGMGDDAANATPVLILHGFPSSSWDFAESAEILAKRRRVVLFDFLGFGLSAKPEDAGYSLFEQAEIAIAVAKKSKLEKVHIWAHDMGTSVATELLARRERGHLPFEIASVTLMNGSVHVEMASLTAGQQMLRSPAGDVFARLAGRKIFGAQMKRIFARPITEETIDGMWGMIECQDGRLRLPKTIQYVSERMRFKRRWIGALERSELPVLIAWAEKDPVAVIAIGERLARDTPGAEMIRWADLGHYPQMEDPARVTSDIEGFITKVDDGKPRGTPSTPP